MIVTECKEKFDECQLHANGVNVFLECNFGVHEGEKGERAGGFWYYASSYTCWKEENI